MIQAKSGVKMHCFPRDGNGRLPGRNVSDEASELKPPEWRLDGIPPAATAGLDVSDSGCG